MIVRRTTILALLLLGIAAAAPSHAEPFRADWATAVDRTWVGPQFWANRLHDWTIRDGRVECVADSPRLAMRTLHLLTHQLADRPAGFEMSVRLGLATEAAQKVSDTSAAGFLLGAGRGQLDHRAAALVHGVPGPGGGVLAGVRGDGTVFLRDNEQPRWQSPGAVGRVDDVLLKLTATPLDEQRVRLTLRALDPDTGDVLSEAASDWSSERLVGNVALVSHPGAKRDGGAAGRYWFADWQVAGERFVADPAHRLGPVLCTQYTLSRGVMKMTAQMAPLGEQDNQQVLLQTREGNAWSTVARTEIIVPGYTAPFRVAEWDATRDVPYRVVYEMRTTDGAAATHAWEGTVRRDPVEKPTIVVAGFTGNHNNSHGINRAPFDWTTGVWFPHADLTERVAVHRPDVLFFSGDQVYEGASPTFADREHIKLDYLYKWFLWCWAYRDMTKDIPCITIPDDHDVYQGNLWGEGGRVAKRDHFGGYVHPADFVKMVERTQTSHLPDPFDPRPIEQGIGVYFTDMVYGRVSLAVIEDRKFKSGCADRLPPTGTARPDHINDPEFDIARADVPGVTLLGPRQLKFLEHWAADWRGCDMKMAVSQTVFANMATHHGGGLQPLRADLDSNGWPQTGRNKAMHELRRGFALHLAGDQHLATLVHHGIDAHDDAGWSFAVPSVANFYPRMWKPAAEGVDRPPGTPAWLGKHHDGFGHPVNVFAASNPGSKTGYEPAALHDKMPGYGIVKLDKAARTYTAECWPRYADPRDPNTAAQYPGWPRTIDQLDNYGRKPVGYLPAIRVTGLESPVVQLIDETDGQVVYTLRIHGQTFRPKVFRDAAHTVIVSEPDTGQEQRHVNVNPVPEGGNATLDVEFP